MSTVASKIPTGTILPNILRPDHYVILNFIAAGGYGAVYKAKHIPTSNIVAIKIMQWEKLKRAYKSIFREVIILQQVRHPNVICCLDMFLIPRSGGSGEEFDLAIVMPYVANTLSTDFHATELVKNETMLVCELYYLLRGIDYYHKCGLIHRDLSHRNVLVSSTCHITFDLFVADFGLSRQNQHDNMDRSFYVTTRAYRAPEVILRHPTYSSKIDIWAVGCILARLLLGNSLFDIHPSVDPVTKVQRVQLVEAQIVSILSIVGDPSEEEVLEFVDSQGFRLLSKILARDGVQSMPSRVEDILRQNCQVPLPPCVLQEFIKLIQFCLAIGPSRRPTAEEILATF
eukprot:PhF_6_TR44259/c1_g3_i3/m.68151/K04441/P38; p38 MAP kinase